MKIKTAPLEIKSDNPFENDLLSRKTNSDILTRFVLQVETPYVIGVDGNWGSGKTTFIKMWMESLIQQQSKVLYINAWESDYQNDPFIPIAKEFEKFFSAGGSQSADVKKFLKSAKEVGKYILKKSIPTTVAILSQGTLKIDEAIEKGIADISKSLSDDLIKEYENNKIALTTLKNSLKVLASALKIKPAVIIIDELDRCKPLYAIQFLERIKHFFSVENVVFILVINQKQMEQSIKAIYGQIDAKNYLSKFIDHYYRLPTPTTESFIESLLAKHEVKDFFEKRKKYTNLSFDYENLIAITKILFNNESVSFRDIEQMISHLVIVLKLTPEDQFLFPSFVLLLIFLRRYSESFYKQIKDLNGSLQILLTEICKKFNLPPIEKTHELIRILALLEHSKQKRDYNYEPLKDYLLQQQDTSASAEKKEFLEKLIRVIEHYDGSMMSFDIVKSNIEKLELATPFVESN